MAQPDNAAGWDALADAYREHVGWVDGELTWGLRCPPESELQLISDVVDGATTVVLGCGGGEDLVALDRLGAGPLTGVDPSARQLAHARERCESAGIDVDLVATGAQDLSALADASADLIVSVQAFDYLDEPAAAIAEVARVLRPGGLLAFSTLHPADVCTDEDPPHGWHASWFQGEHRWMWDDLADTDVPFVSWFRSASEWFTICTEGGLVVERLVEPAPADDPRWIERGWLSPTGYAKGDTVPSTILVRARRPA